MSEHQKVIFDGYFPDPGLEGRYRVLLYDDCFWVQYLKDKLTPSDENAWGDVSSTRQERKIITKALNFITGRTVKGQHCNFCGKSRKEVHRLIESAIGPRICDECLVVSFAKMIESPVKFQELEVKSPHVQEQVAKLKEALKPPSPETSDWCPTCKQGWECAKNEQQCRVKLQAARDTLQPLKDIADAYDANELDDEARKRWGANYEHENELFPDKIELYSGRGGKQLLTLQQCFNAREALKDLHG